MRLAARVARRAADAPLPARLTAVEPHDHATRRAKRTRRLDPQPTPMKLNAADDHRVGYVREAGPASHICCTLERLCIGRD